MSSKTPHSALPKILVALGGTRSLKAQLLLRWASLTFCYWLKCWTGRRFPHLASLLEEGKKIAKLTETFWFISFLCFFFLGWLREIKIFFFPLPWGRLIIATLSGIILFKIAEWPVFLRITSCSQLYCVLQNEEVKALYFLYIIYTHRYLSDLVLRGEWGGKITKFCQERWLGYCVTGHCRSMALNLLWLSCILHFIYCMSWQIGWAPVY